MRIQITAGNVSADLVVIHMNIRGGLLRDKLTWDGMQAPRLDAIEQIIATGKYPKLLACLESGTITRKGIDLFTNKEIEITQDARTLTLDEFIALPDEIGEAWSDEVEKENPHIHKAPQPVDKDAEKKS